MSFSFSALAAAGRLNSPCLPGGECVDRNTECITGVCLCLKDYFQKNGRCGMSSQLSYQLLFPHVIKESPKHKELQEDTSHI